jgi:hypothetical protein
MRAPVAAAITLMSAILVGDAYAQTPDRGIVEPPPELPWHISPEEIHKPESCKTRLTYMPTHATQVSYSRADGQIFLWYPGNHVVLEGKWEARPSAICFRYGTNTRNPATNTPRDRWQCMPARDLDRYTVETADGDVLDLAQRKLVLFILPKVRTTIAALRDSVQGAPPPNMLRTLPPDRGCTRPIS